VSTFSISHVVERTGVPEGTLRMWERRHDFPRPERLPSGHRRYSERDIALVAQVAADRAAGVSLTWAIERALREAEAPVPSLYAALRQRRPDLEPRTLPKRVMRALSHAIEEESLSRAERPLLFASFQRERFYRQEEARWRELARNAELTLAFADFARLRAPRGAPAEVPIDPDHPLAREWAIVCDAPGHSVCLAGWEPAASATGPAGERFFESIWSVEPVVVREAARICAAIAAAQKPGLVSAARERLDSSPALATHDQLRLATAITNRTLSYID
jgi:DICT domain-containing protein